MRQRGPTRHLHTTCEALLPLRTARLNSLSFVSHENSAHGKRVLSTAVPSSTMPLVLFHGEEMVLTGSGPISPRLIFSTYLLK